MDASRFGLTRAAAGATLLERAAGGYLPGALSAADQENEAGREDAPGTGLAWAAATDSGGVGGLRRSRPGRTPVTGLLSARPARPTQPPGPGGARAALWDALIVHASGTGTVAGAGTGTGGEPGTGGGTGLGVGDATRLGQAARDRGLYRYAAACGPRQ